MQSIELSITLACHDTAVMLTVYRSPFTFVHQSPWLLRVELDRVMMVDKKLTMEGIQQRIQEEYQVHHSDVSMVSTLLAWSWHPAAARERNTCASCLQGHTHFSMTLLHSGDAAQFAKVVCMLDEQCTALYCSVLTWLTLSRDTGPPGRHCVRSERAQAGAHGLSAAGRLPAAALDSLCGQSLPSDASVQHADMCTSSLTCMHSTFRCRLFMQVIRLRIIEDGEGGKGGDGGGTGEVNDETMKKLDSSYLRDLKLQVGVVFVRQCSWRSICVLEAMRFTLLNGCVACNDRGAARFNRLYVVAKCSG